MKTTRNLSNVTDIFQLPWVFLVLLLFCVFLSRAEDRTQGLALARQSTLPNPWWWCVPFQQNCGQNWKLGNADFSKSRVNKSGLAHRHKEKNKTKLAFVFWPRVTCSRPDQGAGLIKFMLVPFSLPPQKERIVDLSVWGKLKQMPVGFYLFIYFW